MILLIQSVLKTRRKLLDQRRMRFGNILRFLCSGGVIVQLHVAVVVNDQTMSLGTNRPGNTAVSNRRMARRGRVIQYWA